MAKILCKGGICMSKVNNDDLIRNAIKDAKKFNKKVFIKIDGVNVSVESSDTVMSVKSRVKTKTDKSNKNRINNRPRFA